MRIRLTAVHRLILLMSAMPFLVGSASVRTNFNDRVLAAHNRERARMSVPPLQWDDKLATGAAAWARHLSASGRFEHSPNNNELDPEGENIWGGTPDYYLPENMVGLWIAEKKNYEPGIFPANSRSGKVDDVSHYTQLVWRRTSHVGCAISHAGAEEVLVCRYSSSGNVIGQPVL